MSNRKQKLQDRARRYATLRETGQHGYEGYQEGYRAAMRDLRKLVRAVNVEVPASDGSFRRSIEVVRQRHVHTSVMVRRWLRPLR